MTEQTISIRQILDDLLVHPKLKDLTLEKVVRYTVNFIRILGCPFIFTEKTCKIEIRNHKAALPCDFYQIVQMRTEKEVVYQLAQHSFHSVDYSDDMTGPTYKIQGGFIISSERDDDATLVYSAICTDEDGFPVLPDNSAFIRALELFIKKEEFTMLFEMEKLNYNILDNVQREYAFAVGQATTQQNKMTIDRMESLRNSITTLVRRATQHRHGYEWLGAQEEIKIH